MEIGEGTILYTCRDITERKKAETALVDAERYTRNILDSIYSNIAIVKKDGTIESVNLAWRKFAEENPPLMQNVCEGANYFAVCNQIPGEDGDRARMFIQGIQDVLDGRFDTYKIEYPCHSPHKKRWFTGSISPFHGDRTNRVVVAHTDITERKLAEEALRDNEERYRTIYNKTPVMLHSIDRKGRLIGVSDYWLETMGYERKEVIGRKSIEFLSEESRRYAEEIALPAFFKQGSIKDIPYQFVKKNGQIIDVLLSAIAEYDSEGEMKQTLAVVKDVTAQKRTEDALRESEKKFRDVVSNIPGAVYQFVQEQAMVQYPFHS